MTFTLLVATYAIQLFAPELRVFGVELHVACRRLAWAAAVVSIGLLVVIIRIWGGLPEGVMYAILLMNALVPFINRATQPRKFGSPGRGTQPAAEKEQ